MVTHVSNGDMVTLALIQGVVNTFVIFLSAWWVISSTGCCSRMAGLRSGFWITTIVAEIVLGILATMIVMWFSRRREFRADVGGAALAGRPKMIAALERLKLNHEQSTLPEQVKAFGIAGGGSIMGLFRSIRPWRSVSRHCRLPRSRGGSPRCAAPESDRV